MVEVTVIVQNPAVEITTTSFNIDLGNMPTPGESGVSDHGALTGLDDDDHTQYHNNARGDARYYTQAQVDTALSGKANSSHTHTASQITDFSTAADARITAARGANDGIAPLDSSGKVPAANLPSYVDDVLEYTDIAAFPVSGSAGVIYVALDTNKSYRWSGSAYTEISASPGSTDAVTEGSTNLYFTAARAIASALTGFAASAGVVSATDTILQAFQKIVGNIAGKQGALTLTTIGTSGAATLISDTLNIPQYSGGTGGGTVVVVPGLVSLTNPTYPEGQFEGLVSGDNVLYTAPANRRAIINAISVYNNNAASRNFYPIWGIGGTNYKYNTVLACGANSQNQVATSVVIILDPGQSWGMNVSGSDMMARARIVEFDDTSPVYAAVKYSGWTNGDNTIYTVPADKCAILIDGVGTVQQNVTSCNYYNSSGGSRTVAFNGVKSGGSPAASNRISASAAIANDAKTNIGMSYTMDEGDYISLNTNSTANTQFAWVMVMELPK